VITNILNASLGLAQVHVNSSSSGNVILDELRTILFS